MDSKNYRKIQKAKGQIHVKYVHQGLLHAELLFIALKVHKLNGGWWLVAGRVFLGSIIMCLSCSGSDFKAPIIGCF